MSIIVDDARLIMRRWSARLHAAALVVFGTYEPIKNSWGNLPDDIRANFSPAFVHYVGYALLALGFASMFIRQPKLDAERDKLQ